MTVSAPLPYQVNISWTDNSNNETNFEIERSATGIGGTYSLIVTVAANTTSYNDVIVNSSSEYCYRVRAINVAGSSAYSSPSCATTPAEGNYALSLGSSNAYVTFGTASSLGTSTFTLEAWVNKTGTGVTTGTGTGGLTAALPIITKGRGEAETPANLNMNYFLGIDNTGKLAADFEDKATGLNHPVTGVATLSNNTWYHIAATYDGTTWKLYLNGNLDRELIVGAFLPENTSIQHAALGSALTSTGVAAGFFAGIIDEARIWSYAKTIEQIRSDINLQIITNQTGLLARWGLNEVTGTVVHSNAGTSVNGTLTGTGSSWVTPGAPFNFSFTPPMAPSALTASAPSAYLVNLSWTDNSNNETNFEIERSTTGISGTYTSLATVGANVTSYGDGTVTISNEYCYRVRAINSFGNSAYSDPACATPAEGDYSLDFGSGTAYVTFGNNAALGLANITLETWFKREGAGTTANTGTSGMYAIPLVTKGRGEAENSNVDMNYFLGIRASDNVIAADFEEGASGSTPGLNHPIFGTTTIVNDVWYHAAATYDGNTWYLYLNGNLEAQLYVGQPLRSDCIQHAGLGTAMNSTGVTEGHFDGVLDEVRIWNYARTSGEIISTINSQITVGQTGLVARWGLNEGTGTTVYGGAGTTVNGTITGTGSSWLAPGAPFNISFTPPAAPTNLVVITNSSSVLQLTWTDNSDNESGFEIERSTTGIGGTYSLLTTVPANTTSYLDQALTPETEYCYQVRAINSGGNSAYTNAYCEITDFEPAIATLIFQEGVTGYAGTVDTYIYSADAGNSFGTLEFFQWDGEDPNGQTGSEQDALIRFENIFGEEAGKIPSDAVIQSATLSYTVYDVGNEADVYNILTGWSESTSWNSFGTTAGIQVNEDYNSTKVTTTTGSSSAGEKTINVTSSIITWLADPSLNYGWLFRPTGNSGVEVRSSEFATTTARPKLTVTYLANPPDQPVLVAPLNNATNVSTSPTLSVSVSDPENRDLTVRFYGRQVSTSTPGEDFTVVALPDAQNYTAGLSGGTLEMFTDQTDWCVNQRVARNIVYVAMEGDITNDNNNTQWANAVTAMSILENPLPGLPYSISLGNHDGAPTNTTLYNDNFGISRFTGRSYYGGHYGSDNNNNFSLFSAGGMDFIVITLGFANATPTPEVFAWANDLLQNDYSDRRAIVLSHDLLSGNNWTTPGQAIYDALKGNPNLFLMLAGHLDTEGLRTDTFNGNTIYTVRTDYQGTGSGGNGWLRIFTFSPANNNFTISSYSPYLNQSNFGGNSPIILPYEMSPTNDYVPIGTNTNVTSASTTSITWPGRLNNTEYEWYVEVSNGESAITGPTWSFTTEDAPVAAYEVYLSSSTSAATEVLYPNTAWGVTSHEPDDWNFTSPVSLYIVPEVGSVFGASDITIQWDNTIYGYVGVENLGIYSGANFQSLHSTNGTTDQVIINAARTDNANFNIALGDYIAKLNLNLLKSGFGTVNFTALDFRSFDGLGGRDSSYCNRQ